MAANQSNSALLQEILSKLKSVKYIGSGRNMSLCPAHADKEASLSITTGDDGRVLLKCHAGCVTEDVVHAIGVEMKDLFPSTTSKVKQETQGCTLAQYAELKGLPIPFLRGLGTSNSDYYGKKVVQISYRRQDGSEGAVQYRTALQGEDKFRFKKGSKPFLYGLDHDFKSNGYVVIVEGPSDAQTLLFNKIPVLGLPGADMWNEERDAPHLDGIEKIFVWVEPDKGGETVKKWLSTSRIRDRVRLISPNGCKDASELYLHDRENFKANMEKLILEAVPWEETQTKQNIEKEPEPTIEEMIQNASLETLQDILKRLAGLSETARATYINALSRKLDVPKRSIQKDLQTISQEKEDHPNIDRLLEVGANPESRYSAQNYIDGVLSFGGILGKERVLVRSDGEILLADGSDGDSFRFKRSTLTAEAIKRFRSGEDVEGRDLLNQIRSLFSDHIVFKDDRIPTLLGVWVIGTYLFKVFRYYAYLWVNSPVKRCAKSLLLDILSFLCFNSTSRLVDPSPSFLFREVDSNDGTLILDEIESLGGADKDQKKELIALLNAGFQRGSQAPRMESRNKEFVVTYFNAYSPKALAGIKSIVDTIEDRTFKISMTRKKKSESIKRFNLRTLDSTIEKIKEDCFLWALRYAAEVVEVYEQDDSKFPGTESLDDRLKDILEPMLSIGAVIDTQANDTSIPTMKILVDLARDMGRGRDDQEALSGAIPAAVNVLKDMIDGIDERFVSADDLFSKFQANEDLIFIQTKRGLAFFLAKIELHRTPRRWVDGKAVRGYLITRKWVEDLAERYV
jgi:hypothetical protein